MTGPSGATDKTSCHVRCVDDGPDLVRVCPAIREIIGRRRQSRQYPGKSTVMCAGEVQIPPDLGTRCANAHIILVVARQYLVLQSMQLHTYSKFHRFVSTR